MNLQKPWFFWMLNSLILLLLSVAALSLAQLFWRAIAPTNIDVVTQLPAFQEISSAGQAQVPLSNNLGKLFGHYRAPVSAPTPVVNKATDVPPVPVVKNTIELILRGVFAASDPKAGSAVISQQSAASENFNVGDTVFGQALLSQVFKDRVVLDVDGEKITLYFEATSTASEVALQNEPSLQPSFDQGAGVSRPTGSPSVIGQKSVASNVPTVRTNTSSPVSLDTIDSKTMAAMVNQFISAAKANPGAVATQFGLELDQQGYRVTSGARDLIFLGMRPGDVILSVNDKLVGNPSEDAAMIDQIMAVGDVKVDVKRGSRVFSIFQTIPKF